MYVYQWVCVLPVGPRAPPLLYAVSASVQQEDSITLHGWAPRFHQGNVPPHIPHLTHTHSPASSEIYTSLPPSSFYLLFWHSCSNFSLTSLKMWNRLSQMCSSMCVVVCVQYYIQYYYMWLLVIQTPGLTGKQGGGGRGKEHTQIIYRGIDQYTSLFHQNKWRSFAILN